MGGHDWNVEYLRDRFPHAKILRWTNHLHTVRRAMEQCRTRMAWIVSSCIRYDDFDFTWEPVPWQSHQIHCWPSGDQQFGDTFLVPLAHWKEQTDSLVHLEQFRDVNFEHASLARLPWQTCYYSSETIPELLPNVECRTPYLYCTNQPQVQPSHDPWLWREQPVVSFTTDNGCSLIPRAAMGTIQQQVYDYPYLKKHHDRKASQPLDIVFISNGEHGAEYHWEVLNQTVPAQQNRIHRVDRINGRVACYQAAARASETDWFFAVFAKLQVNTDFDWLWQPDRWQRPKHYIFHALNPVNNLVYGHQAMIAYHRDLVLENTGKGLDFTLDQSHEVVPMISGTSYYDNDPWTCWRTAFREALKLKHSLPDVENEYRLEQWLTVGQGPNGHWSMTGARDAMDYYGSVNGDFSQLKKSYEWAWLSSYALMLHPQLFTQSNT